MSDLPLVSIVTPSFNQARYIEATIRSVLTQDYPRIEYIIVDGGSTDGTLDIVKSFEPLFDRRLRWISEKDNGIYDAMNKGINLAKGRYIGILNSDDWYELDTLKNVVSALNDKDDIITYGILRYIKGDKELMLHRNSHHFLSEAMIPHPTSFVPKSIYQKYGLYNTQYPYAADYEFFLRLWLAGVKFECIDKVLANFRMEGKSIRRSDDVYIETLKIQHRYKLKTISDVYLNTFRVRIRNFLRLKSSRI